MPSIIAGLIKGVIMQYNRINEWSTPQVLMDAIPNPKPFDIDVCANPANAKANTFFTAEDDGLIQEWRGLCWMNPPQGRSVSLQKWVEKAYIESRKAYNDGVWCLLPASTSTKWFHKFAVFGYVLFLKGRVKFVSLDGVTKGSPAFDSMLIIFDKSITPSMDVWDWKA